MSIGRFLVGTVVAVTVLVPAGGEGDEPASASATAHRQTATFAMYCYWTGEATLGRVDGVLASRIGHWGGREIVQVDFDPRRTDVAALVRALARQRSFDAVVVGETAGGEPPLGAIDPKHVVRHSGSPRFIEPKHSLRTRHPELLALGLDERQAMALNSWSYFGGRMPDVLTAEQKKRLARQP